MAQTIRIRRTSIPGRIPTTSQLALGELALNTADGKLYCKTSVGGVEAIKELSGSSGGITGGGEGGESNLGLAQLSDVTVSNASPGQVLKYTGSGWANMSDAGGISGITVGTFGDQASDVGTSVTAIRFDSNSGFSVVAGPTGAAEARVSLGSSFKTWHVTGQTDLVAEGEDEITIEAGSGIILTTYHNTTTGLKKLTIAGFSGDYNDLTNKPTLGTISSQASSNVSITGGSISGITDLAIADGGTGASTASAARNNLGLGNVNNTSDADKPISTATQTALDLKAPLSSPTFTGIPAAPTATADTNTTQLATTAFVIGQGYLKSSTASSTYALTSAIPVIASQAEAQAGTDNTKMMTPLRVSQAITASGGGGGGSSTPSAFDYMSLISFGVI